MKTCPLTLVAALSALLALAACTAFTGTARAQVFTEDPADAGENLPTAASTAVGVEGMALTTIFGSFNDGTDADLFAFQITTPSTFSATTLNALTDASGLDTELFLFDVGGNAVAVNDDAAGGASVGSELPAGDAAYVNLAAGTYYLGVSLSGNEPLNLNAQLLFDGNPGGDTTTVRGPAVGLNPTAEAGFNGQTFSPQTGSYEIDLTGSATAFNPAAPVPEPSPAAALALGALGAAIVFRRRRGSVTPAF